MSDHKHNHTSVTRRHLTDEDFLKWDLGQMAPEEMEYFLSHISSCDTCAERWMNWMEQTEERSIPQPPAYLAEEILERSREPDMLIARKLNNTSRQLQLITYSLKIGTAVVLSILMLFSINLTNLKIASVSEPAYILDAQTDLERKEAEAAEKIQELQEKQQLQKLQKEQKIKKLQEQKEQHQYPQEQQNDSPKMADITEQLRKGAQGITDSLQNFAASFFE